MTAERPRTGEGLALLRAAGGAGCWITDAMAGRLVGLSASEVRERLGDGAHDRDLLRACLAGFEAGIVSGQQLAKEGET